MGDSFTRQKADILASLGVVDYSPKGSVDKEIVPLINLVNENPDLVTTSSCAGRVSIFIEGHKSRVGGKGDGGTWLFFTHDPQELQGWAQGLSEYRHPEPVNPEEPRRYVLYKFEPFILHVKCRNHETARALASLALGTGFRETGIGPNDNVAIRISMRIDAPIGWLEQDKIHIITSPQYLAELDKLALELFKKNAAKIAALTEKVKQFRVRHTEQESETKKERARRKRDAGLARQHELRSRSRSHDNEEKSSDSDIDGHFLLF